MSERRPDPSSSPVESPSGSPGDRQGDAGPRQPDAAIEEMVDATLERVGREIVLGTPLGLGKANDVVNAFYRRAAADPSIDLTIFTALTLAAPRASSELERRLVGPLRERLFGGYPELAWVDPMRRGELPENIEVREFYFRPGAFLASPQAQRSYISSNYTHVVRDLLDAGLNVLAQGVGAEDVDGLGLRYSLSCNSDLTVDLLPALDAKRAAGEKVMKLAQVNRRLPFLYGDAMVEPDAFDLAVEKEIPLFGAPKLPVDPADYAIALHVSGLVRDGGTLQLGIGSLGDAIVHLLRLRHRDNDTYRELLDACRLSDGERRLFADLGGTEPFDRGLYAATEMLVDGFLELHRCGVLKRRVYPQATLQRALDAGEITAEVTPAMLRLLRDAGDVDDRLGHRDVELLRRVGVLRADVELVGDRLVCGERSLPADLESLLEGAGEELAELEEHWLGDELRGGRLAHSCFFLGPRSFYDGLSEMPPEERRRIEMTGISFVNELYGGTFPGEEATKRAQRRHARFVNTAMMATLGGAAVSDGLEDGRVVSGVGGQYNFVAMAHALEEGRSILMVRSTRTSKGETKSNIRWSYGHVTIPRHLRDLVVTEYGIADLRGKSDEEVIRAMLAVADSRFQDELMEKAKEAGKLAPDYEIPRAHRRNLPERLRDDLAPYLGPKHPDSEATQAVLPRFPFGTDLTREEVVLTAALRGIQKKIENRDLALLPDLDGVKKIARIPDTARPYLERMGLAEPEGMKEKLLQRAVVYALTENDSI